MDASEFGQLHDGWWWTHGGLDRLLHHEQPSRTHPLPIDGEARQFGGQENERALDRAARNRVSDSYFRADPGRPCDCRVASKNHRGVRQSQSTISDLSRPDAGELDVE